MQRRDFMLALAAGTAGCLSACNTARPAAHSASPASSPAQGSPLTSASPSPVPSPTPSLSPLHLQDGPPPLPAPSPADSLITGLPENVGNVVAILVESGQIQLANHTWTHPDLTTLSEGGIIDEITQCENLLRNTYGVTGAPFIRPPYGGRSSYTDSVCAKVGYTTTTMWYGSFGDSGQLTPEVLLGEAQKWLLAQHIVIGHANFPTVTSVYGQIIDILRQRSLQTATLDDVYFGPGHNRHA